MSITTPTNSISEVTQSVAPQYLRATLEQELAGAKAGEPQRHLAVLVELGKLDDPVRQTFIHAHSPGASAHSFFSKKEFAELIPYGPVLIAHLDSVQGLFKDLGAYDGATISAWIVSVLPAEELALHLGNFLFAQQTEEDRCILRYYTPRILPTVRKLANPDWVRELFKPIVHWWLPVATTESETWSAFAGDGEIPDAKLAHRHWLKLDEALWEALESDPLPYKLVNTLRAVDSALFKTNCYGVQVAQVETLIAAAHEQGLQDEDDLLTYAWTLLERPDITHEPRWQAAIARAGRGEAPLSEVHNAVPEQNFSK
jgi:hypothetical protein